MYVDDGGWKWGYTWKLRPSFQSQYIHRGHLHPGEVGWGRLEAIRWVEFKGVMVLCCRHARGRGGIFMVGSDFGFVSLGFVCRE